MAEQHDQQRPVKRQGAQPEPLGLAVNQPGTVLEPRARVAEQAAEQQDLEPHPGDHAQASKYGLSSQPALIQGSDFCWPHTVGMRNGTGESDQRITRQLSPIRRIASAP